ncbi:MAG: heme ABC transporter ATP-binding protein [Firmicutes bacterium]|jgi:iron complex transport system ATP-binding protein|nr:heme ABC transporter ATP-binding protein [Bacillota bacterium]
MRVEVRDVHFKYPGLSVLHGVSFEVEPGIFFGVIGPNGSGKSTLLRVIGGVLRPCKGTVKYDGRDIAEFTPKDCARMVAAVAQANPVVFSFTVAEIVAMGRAPYIRRFSSETAEDWARVRSAMDRTGVLHLADRYITELSSGERQRVFIARALAQDPKVLLLDEPTAHLDVSYQVEICELAAALAHDEGLSVIAVLHDLNLAARYCDRLAMMESGRLFALGTPREIMTPANLLSVYGVRATIGTHPESDRPAVFVLSGNSSSP